MTVTTAGLALLGLVLSANDVAEERGLLSLTVEGKPLEKRYVLRHARVPSEWNGKLVIGAHGGSGGDRLDLEGKVIGTDETALDDVVGRFALEQGFAYASIDRDGIGGTREGLALMNDFTRIVRERIAAALGRKAARTYLVGLSAGGGITRYAAEADPPGYDGALLIAGGGGDAPTRLDRQAQLAALWPAVDPKAHPGLPDGDEHVRAFATVIGTPVAARALWPFTAAGASFEGLARTLDTYGLKGLTQEELRRFRVADYRDRPAFAEAVRRQNTTGKLSIPAIEVVGTFDEIVIAEVLAYKNKLHKASASRHRLYQVEGVWHISGDDDAMSSFRLIARRRDLGEAIDRTLRDGPSYLETVHEALLHLDRWVSGGTAPPPDQTVPPGTPLRR